MKFALPAALPAALVVALGLAGYAAVGGPKAGPNPNTPVPWRNPDKAKVEAAAAAIVQPQQVGGIRVISGPYQVPASWNRDPLYNEWMHMIEDTSFPVGHPQRIRAKKITDPG